VAFMVLGTGGIKNEKVMGEDWFSKSGLGRSQGGPLETCGREEGGFAPNLLLRGILRMILVDSTG